MQDNANIFLSIVRKDKSLIIMFASRIASLSIFYKKS